ncbi:MAG: hypothetical protein COB59_06105 [Rhodospirillaceae bacterium]|nr:MAG: hypothetical protein COB59_06105 [Rhodospirillaceae bacterium]
MYFKLEYRHRIWGSIMLAVIWTVAVGGLFLWNSHLSNTYSNNLARADAIKAFNKDQALRQWAANHGGVYMEALGDIEPNPFMEHIPDRDVMTSSGRLLTLVNPATMVRLIMKEYDKLYGVRGRLVSLEPLNSDNQADEWESNAINAFKAGQIEVGEFTSSDNQDYFRMIRPMKASKVCLKCHAIQGYEVGDVLGGVGIKVPMAPYHEQLNAIFNGNIISHGLTWLLGIFGLTAWHIRGIRNIRKQSSTQSKLATAQISSKIKSDFMSSMSHELRTPLNAIIGFSSTMKAEIFGPVGSDKNREYLDDIHYSGQHLLELINDILDISAIEAGALKLELGNVDLHRVIEDSVRLILPRAHKEEVTITASYALSRPEIQADERRLRQVLLNLLSNAVKFTPAGGEVTIDAHSNADGSMTITITDDGIGMDAEDLTLALSKFGQVDTELHRKTDGTGLGLPLTKDLVELHGGELIICSERDQGTMIKIMLPKF